MLVNELNSVGDPLKNDEWIRNENGIVQNVPNVLWVIGGREKLKWERFNCEWTNALETHLLGNLSFEDSNSFLVNAGVSDCKLCEQLYKLTDGTPVYLDICLDQYLRIYDSGKTPDISMFGKNTFDLIERFVRYMGEAQKDLVYMLACIKKWNNKLVVDLASTILPNFSFSAYEKIKDYSFIVLSEDNNYFIHQTVGNVLMESAPKQLKYLIGKGLSDIFLNTINKKRPFSSEYSAALFYVVQAGLLMYDNREDLLDFYNENLSKSLIEFARTNAIEQAKNDFELIYMRAAQNPNDLFYATVLRDKAVLSLIFSDYKIAKKAAQKSTQLFLNLLGKNHCETIKAMSVLADALEHLREHNSAFALRKDILVRYRKVLGDEHPETINAIYGLSNSAEILGRFETAIKLKKTAIKLCNIVFGENHIKSLKAVQSLVFTLSNAKKHDEAIVLSEANLKKSQQILGTYHTYIEELIFHLVYLYRNAGYSHKAINFLQTEYEKRCRDFGDTHPRTIKILNSMAANLSFMKDYGKALELQQKNLDMCKEFLGDNHPDTIVSMNNLATHLHFQGEYAKAVEMHKETLKRQLIIYEKEHPAVELTMSMMADSYEEMGEIKKAKAIREKIKTLSKKEP